MMMLLENRPEEIVEYATRNKLSLGVAAIAIAAHKRGIQWTRLGSRNRVQLQHGHLQRSIKGTITSQTSREAIRTASNKKVTADALSSYGLPVPVQILVESAADAIKAARVVGDLLVVKPLRGNHGRGVSVGVRTMEETASAFVRAKRECKQVLVESYVSGRDYRLLVVNGTLVAAAQRIPGHIVGNGVDSVAALIDILNQDPRRGVGNKTFMTTIDCDEEADRLLKAHGYTYESVPLVDEVIVLRSYANISAGGTAIDVTDYVHTDNRLLAERAVSIVGLDIGGVDFIIDDVSRSHREIGGGICEVNAGPGLRSHLAPLTGRPRDVATPIIDMLFPAASD
jgi:cyanophycin synthetase